MGLFESLGGRQSPSAHTELRLVGNNWEEGSLQNRLRQQEELRGLIKRQHLSGILPCTRGGWQYLLFDQVKLVELECGSERGTYGFRSKLEW